ncbi:MAG: uracil-DNA glycosylase [Chloroflexi bacterium]|nr:uracil-DNA glycosylase [Chloroflexota bacterium]
MSKLSQLHEEILPCQRCQLARQRTRTVPGEGAENPDIMFIGEAPGYHEDQQGRPFVGSAGQFLTQLLASINLKREQVYITNVIKCRPPQNRDPLPGEIAACRSWLDRQIELIHPKMIVTLGRYSMALFADGKSISKIHGTAQKKGDIIYFAMYHPAAALHQQSLRHDIEQDMLKIPAVLAQAKSVAEVKPEPKPEAKQLNMFGG